MSRRKSQLPLFPDGDSILRPNAEPRDAQPVRPLEIKRHEWSKIRPCGAKADDDDRFVLVCGRGAEAPDERNHIMMCKVLPAKRLGQTHSPFQQPFWQPEVRWGGRRDSSELRLRDEQRTKLLEAGIPLLSPLPYAPIDDHGKQPPARVQ